MNRKVIKPPRLNPGDTVAIISPSNPIDYRADLLEKACQNFEQKTALKTVLAPNAMASWFYSAGTMQQRLDDFHWAFSNDDIKGIVCAAGGNTAIDLLEHIDFELVKANPKVFMGISDATTLLTPLYARAGLVSFLGLEFLDFGREDMSYTAQSVRDVIMSDHAVSFIANPNWCDLRDTPTSYQGWQCIRSGGARGTIIGGNRSSWNNLIGTQYQRFDEKNILVLEAYMQAKKQIHRSLKRLRLQGVFDRINGLIVGYFVGSDNPDALGNDRPIADIVLEATDGYNFPIMQVGEIGHCVENLMLPIGAQAEMDADVLSFGLTEPVVV